MNFNIRQKKVIYAEEPKILCLATAACGKALPNSTSIPTPYGFKEVKDIKIGDFLIDRRGNPTKVLGVFPQGEKEIYKVYFMGIIMFNFFSTIFDILATISFILF